MTFSLNRAALLDRFFPPRAVAKVSVDSKILFKLWDFISMHICKAGVALQARPEGSATYSLDSRFGKSCQRFGIQGQIWVFRFHAKYKICSII